MEILAVKLQQIDHPFASGKVWQMTVQTNYEPAEIIVIRPDGTSESTNPEALRLREQAIKSTIESYEQNRKLIAADVANMRLQVGRLEAELLKEGAKQMNAVSEYLRGRAEIEPEVERLQGEVLRLEEKRELKERLRGEVLRLETLRDVRQALGCTFGDVVATARKVVAQNESLISELDQIGSVLKPSPNHDVISKAREVVSELSQAKAELQRRAKCMEDCGLALGMDKDAAQYSGYVEKRALYVMSELERLKTTYSMDRVHGMPLDEVRGLKAERDGLKSTEASRLRQLEYARQGRDEAQEKLRKTGFILGADMRLSGCVTQAAANIVEDLTRTKRRLETSLQGECDLRNMVHGLTAKLVAVTRALSG